MELGGKGAAIVTEDADIGVAAQAIATVWGFHSGQICTAPTRVIAHKDIYDQLVETLKTFAGFMPVGDPNADGTIVGPVITELHRDRVEAFIKSGTDAGATLVVGGERPELDGYYIAPTLLADCTPECMSCEEEAFGPVIVVMPYEDDDHAVALANDSDYGLYSYVFCGDTNRAYGIGQQLESGNVGLNVIQPHMEAPFGGFKMSGSVAIAASGGSRPTARSSRSTGSADRPGGSDPVATARMGGGCRILNRVARWARINPCRHPARWFPRDRGVGFRRRPIRRHDPRSARC